MLVEKDEQNEVKHTVWSDGDKCLRENKPGKKKVWTQVYGWGTILVATDGLSEWASSE